MNLDNLFRPQKIAVVGASSDRKKIGRQILDNIISSGYQGNIYPINLRAKKIAGLNSFATLEDIPENNKKSILVVIAIPAQYVKEEVIKCGKLGIKNIIIISAGFKESGNEGEKIEMEIANLAQEYNLNILGPNCLGMINNVLGLNASFSKSKGGAGNIALLSQSGAIGSTALDWLSLQKMNLAYFVSLGNKAVLNENHFLDYLKNDKNIDAIVFYLEDIKQGQEFMAKASQVSPHKPVVVLFAGLSSLGGQLAKSHTGALAKEEKIILAALERAGVLAISKLSDLFSLLPILKLNKISNKIKNTVKIISNAGGLAVLSADSMERNNLKLVSSNDILGDATVLDYELALNKALKEKGNDNILVLLSPQTATKPLEIAKIISTQAKKYPHKLILCSFVGGESVQAARKLLRENNVPEFSYPEVALRAISQLSKRREMLDGFGAYKIDEIKSKARKIKTDYIGLLKDLKKYGLKVIKTAPYEKSKRISCFPVVLKAVGPDFIHKSDSGSVILNLENKKQVDKAAKSIWQKEKKAFKNTDNYLIVQKQASDGIEIILGIKRDDFFGPVILVGMGGIYAEVLKQSTVLIADLNEKRALREIKKMSFYPILNGARGKKYDIKGLVKAMVSLCDIARKHPEIKELDINPLLVTEDSNLVLDARVFID